MFKKILCSSEARSKILAGMEKVYKVVVSTLGPKGREVLMEHGKGLAEPIITKDGITCINNMLPLEDREENLGAQLIRSISRKTNDVAGDGSTTSSVLGYNMATVAFEALNKGAPSIDIKKGIDKATEEAISLLKKMAIPVKTREDIKSIATISANNDPEIGEVVASVFEKIGKDGLVTVKDGVGTETTIDYVEGVQFDKGTVNPYFLTKNSPKIEYKDAYILITDKEISNTKDILNLLNQMAKEGKPLVIVCADCLGEALMTLITNYTKNVLKVIAVKAPYAGLTQREFLEDLAALTGGTFITEDKGLRLENVTLKELGQATDVKIDLEKTIISGCKGKKTDISKRIEKIKESLENPENNEMANKLYKERLAKLTGGAAIINVGYTTDVEMSEKRFRYDDTISAARSALEEGIIPGGGVALLRVSQKMNQELTESEMVGYNIVKKAMESPMRNIYRNAGLDEDEVVNTVKEFKGDEGLDLEKNKINMIEAGIIDPVKVTRTALANAASIVGHVIMTEATIVDGE